MLFNISQFFAILFSVMAMIMAIPYHFGGKNRSGKYCLSMGGILILSAMCWATAAGAERSHLLRLSLPTFVLSFANGVLAMRIMRQGIFHSTEP